MKWLLPSLVVCVLAAGAGFHLLAPRSALPTTIGVALLDKASGERIEFGNSADQAGHLFTKGSWTSKDGEKVEEDYQVLSARSARLDFVITRSGVTRTFALTAPLQDRMARTIRWQAFDDHFETFAYAGGVTVTE